MKAAQLVAHGAPGKFELRDVPDPQPGPGEAIVQVHACGLNHLDLWLEEGGLPIPVKLPRTPGGEVAGEILEIGPGGAGVSLASPSTSQRDAGGPGWKIGDAVAIQSNLFCGECEFCQRGED